MSSTRVSHDSWCKSEDGTSGKPCNCFPDITLVTEFGVYTVDDDGNCSPAN